MENHHFISYSTVDAQNFAIKLCDKLKAGPPSFSAWLDKRELKPGPQWDDQIVESIRSCESLIFVMTNDSVRSRSVCKNEWTRAMKYKKTVIPILLHENAETPFQLENRQYLDFTGDFETALAKLRSHLLWLNSREGKLQSLRDRLMDAESDLQRTDDPNKQKRIQDDIDSLKKQISVQQQIVADPDGTAQRVQENINNGLERERASKEQVAGITQTKFINPPPVTAPAYFQDRIVETKLVGDILKDTAQNLITIVGRGGVGKSAMVCRLLKSLESGKMPDNGEELKVDGIVYLSESTSKKINFANIFSDLCQLLDQETAQKLEGIYKDAKLSTSEKTYALCRAFPKGRYVLLLDNFEDKIDTEARRINDEELEEALKAFLTCEAQNVNIIITTRIAPKSLALVESNKQFRLDLDEGLEHPYAENILRKMDKDGKLGLKDATDELLNVARLRTKGFPRALEALFAILSTDRDTTLEEILADAAKLLPDHVVEKLVGEAFSRLDDVAQKVMQALAIVGRPISNAAVDFILQPYVQGINSSLVLKRLVDMHFIRKEAIRYYMHPVDREYALSHIPEGEKSENYLDSIVFSRFALLHRGAEFFKLARLPRQEWKNINDLAAQLTEFDLRFNLEDYDTAASLLLEIDFDYLLLWGHSRLTTQLHEQLLGKISDLTLKQNSVGNLGTAYYNMGQYQQAISCYEKALVYAHEINNREGEGAWLGNLGNCFKDLGETRRAIEFHEQALEINRETGYQEGEANTLNSLGTCYSDLGETRRAIEFHEKALEIDRKIGSRTGEANNISNLGNRYYDLGETKRAVEFNEQALKIDREIGNRQGEAISLANLSLFYSYLGETRRAIEYCELAIKIAKEISFPLVETASLIYVGEVFIDEDKFIQAIENLRQAIQIADDIEYMQFRNESRFSLSKALFFTKDLPDAGKLLNEARKCSYPNNNYNIAALQGLIYIFEKNLSAACEEFSTAVNEADTILKKTESNYKALDCKGLSLSGLAICQRSGGYISKAEQCYKNARAINKDKGYVKRVLRLFDRLSEMDEEGILKNMRSIVAGE